LEKSAWKIPDKDGVDTRSLPNIIDDLVVCLILDYFESSEAQRTDSFSSNLNEVIFHWSADETLTFEGYLLDIHVLERLNPVGNGEAIENGYSLGINFLAQGVYLP
jgi:hypothetical protein